MKTKYLELNNAKIAYFEYGNCKLKKIRNSTHSDIIYKEETINEIIEFMK